MKLTKLKTHFIWNVTKTLIGKSLSYLTQKSIFIMQNKGK